MRLFRHAVFRAAGFRTAVFRYAAVAAVLAAPVLIAAAPATYAASAASASRAASGSGGSTAFATPSVAMPGSRVTFTADCSPAAGIGAGATLFGTTLGLPARIPMNAESSNSFTFTISVDLPSDLAAATYHPDIDCPGGSSATATLRVAAFPSGGAATGDGTTSTTSNSTSLALAGLALIGAGALAGGFALRRRGGARPRG
jgi:hypothetical protein